MEDARIRCPARRVPRTVARQHPAGQSDDPQQISQNERLAMLADFETMARRRIEAEQRELDDLDTQEAALRAELGRNDLS